MNLVEPTQLIGTHAHLLRKGESVTWAQFCKRVMDHYVPTSEYHQWAKCNQYRYTGEVGRYGNEKWGYPWAANFRATTPKGV